MHAFMNKSNIMTYVNSLPFINLLITSNFSSVLNLSPILHLDCTRWCKFTCLTHVGKKRQFCRRGA